MRSLLLIVYLAGAIGTTWLLNASTANRERLPFFSIRCLVWPLTATVFGLLVLIALLAHWYDQLATAFTDRRAVWGGALRSEIWGVADPEWTAGRSLEESN